MNIQELTHAFSLPHPFSFRRPPRQNERRKRSKKGNRCCRKKKKKSMTLEISERQVNKRYRFERRRICNVQRGQITASKTQTLKENLTHLKANANRLGQSAFRQHCLHLWHNSGGQHTTFISNHHGLLLDTAHQSKVLGKISCQDTRDALGLQIFLLVQFWSGKMNENKKAAVFNISLQIKEGRQNYDL